MTIFDQEVTPEISYQEFMRGVDYRVNLLEKTEALRKSDNLRYSKLIEKYQVEHSKLYLMPVERLKELVKEI